MEMRRLQADLTKRRQRYFIRADSDRTRANSFKLKEGKSRLDLRKKLFTLSMVWH